MERLTELHGGIWGMSVKAVKNGYDRYSVFSRLAAYENTGLTPEEIVSKAKALETAYTAITRLEEQVTKIYTQLMEMEKAYHILNDFETSQLAIAVEEQQQAERERDYWRAEAIKANATIGEIKIWLHKRDY